MRRKEREITEIKAVEEIIDRAQICRLAMCVDDQPYVVPLCFGYRAGALYFHCALEGKKLDIVRRNSNVCFECDVDTELVVSGNPCEWGMKGRSVVGFGKISLIEEPRAKRDGFDVIMEHYGAKGPFSYKEKGLEKAMIMKVQIEKMTGKKVG